MNKGRSKATQNLVVFAVTSLKWFSDLTGLRFISCYTLSGLCQLFVSSLWWRWTKVTENSEEWERKSVHVYKPSRSSGWQLHRLQCSTKRLGVLLPTLNWWNGWMLVHHWVTAPALNSLVPSYFIHLGWESEALRVMFLAKENMIMSLVRAWIQILNPESSTLTMMPLHLL